jgi:hypothetical protein
LRRGKKRAIVALGHALLIIVYHVLKRQTTMSSWGPTAWTASTPIV